MNTKSYFAIIALCGTLLAFGGGVRASDSAPSSSPSNASTIWDNLTTKKLLTENDINAYVKDMQNAVPLTQLNGLFSACDIAYQVFNAVKKDGDYRVQAINYIVYMITNITAPILRAFIASDTRTASEEFRGWADQFQSNLDMAVASWKKHDNKEELNTLEQSFVESVTSLITLLTPLAPDSTVARTGAGSGAGAGAGT